MMKIKNSLFARMIITYWEKQFFSGETIYDDRTFALTINPQLDEDSQLMILEMTDGQVLAVMTPRLFEKLQVEKEQQWSETVFREKLKEANIQLHGADYLFYYTDADKNSLQQDIVGEGIRQLTPQDTQLFTAFEEAATEQDLDDALVELDHWTVYGSFEEGRLVCAASMYPWETDVKIADLGVLTLAAYRGKGHARQVVQAIGKYVYEQGYEPQYRCQLDNTASIMLAKSAGLSLFGKWDVISVDSRI